MALAPLRVNRLAEIRCSFISSISGSHFGFANIPGNGVNDVPGGRSRVPPQSPNAVLCHVIPTAGPVPAMVLTHVALTTPAHYQDAVPTVSRAATKGDASMCRRSCRGD